MAHASCHHLPPPATPGRPRLPGAAPGATPTLTTITTITTLTLTLKPGNFGTVFLDNGYYNKAIAASPVHALPGYILGGLSWFAIPWLTATTMGLAGVALETNPAFPTYPERMTDAEVSAGLVLPYAAVALLGKGGAVATLLIVFMAVTSATSSELIATSSIFTYDLYRTYFNPEASGKRLIYMSHVLVVAYALFISTFSVGLWYAGISMGYLYVMMGVIISSAVLPATLTLIWAGQNKWAAGLSPILGLVVALIAWLVTAKKECGALDVKCTGSNNPMLAGNVAALLSPVIFIPILTLIFGMDHYDWKSMLAIRKGDDHDLAGEAGVDLEETVGGHEETAAEFEEEQKKLARAGKISKIMTVVMVRTPPHHLVSAPSLTLTQTLAFLVIWPMPMYGTGYIFSKKFFTGWVVVGIIWIFCSFFGVGLFPIFEGRKSLARTFKFLIKDITGKSHPKTLHAQDAAAEDDKTAGDATPPEKAGVKEQIYSS